VAVVALVAGFMGTPTAASADTTIEAEAMSFPLGGAIREESAAGGRAALAGAVSAIIAVETPVRTARVIVRASAVGPEPHRRPARQPRGTDPPPADTCSLYASPTGSPSASGSSRTAPTTVHAAAARSVPGSVVCLVGGTYDVAKEVYVNRSGEAGKPIVFRSEGGQALLRWTGSSPPAGASYAVFKLASYAHHVEFAGLTIDGANRASQGVKCNRYAHHLVIRDSTIRNTGSAGVATKLATTSQWPGTGSTTPATTPTWAGRAPSP
jgi:hypothetical protein